MSLDATLTNVLLISNAPGDARVITAALNADHSVGLPCFVLVDQPVGAADGLARLAAGGVDVLLLDLDGTGEDALDTLVRARIQAPELAVVLLVGSGAAAERLAAEAVEAGAHDVVARDQLGDGVLPRVLRYAIERQRLQATLQQLSLSDELTGLYNRRGFAALSEHHLKLAHRTRGLLLAALDVPGLARINERQGRADGDRALASAANVLRATFRASDVIARLDGGNFAVLMLDAGDDAADAVTARLRARLDQHNAEHGNAGYALELTMGIARFDPRHDAATVDELLRRALAARA